MHRSSAPRNWQPRYSQRFHWKAHTTLHRLYDTSRRQSLISHMSHNFQSKPSPERFCYFRQQWSSHLQRCFAGHQGGLIRHRCFELIQSSSLPQNFRLKKPASISHFAAQQRRQSSLLIVAIRPTINATTEQNLTSDGGKVTSSSTSSKSATIQKPERPSFDVLLYNVSRASWDRTSIQD